MAAIRDKTLLKLRTFYLGDVAKALEISPQYIRCLIHRYPDHFNPPTYRRKGSNPRRHRVFTLDEVAFLKSRLLVKNIMKAPL